MNKVDETDQREYPDNFSSAQKRVCDFCHGTKVLVKKNLFFFFLMTSPISINSRRETLSDKDFTTESGPIASKQSQSSRIARKKKSKTWTNSSSQQSDRTDSSTWKKSERKRMERAQSPRMDSELKEKTLQAHQIGNQTHDPDQ